MKKRLLFLGVMALLSIGIELPKGHAQTAAAQASNNCPPRKVGTPEKSRYQNLSAVGLLVTDYSKLQRLVDCHGREEDCSKEDFSKSKNDPTLTKSVQWIDEKVEYYKSAYAFYPPSVQFDAFIAEFVKQINWEIVPWLKQDENCKTSDVAVFKTSDDPGAVNNFMKVPGRLLIVAKVNFVALPPPENLHPHWSPREKFHDVMAKWGPPILVISIEYFRSDELPFNLEDTVLDAKEIVLPLSLGEEYIAQRVTWFINNIAIGPRAKTSSHN